MKHFHLTLKPLKTSNLIILSSFLCMSLMCFVIGFSLHKNLSAYVLNQSAKYTDSIALQIQQRLNASLSEMDSNIQRLCNDHTLQRILYDCSLQRPLSSEDQLTVHQLIMETLNYADAIKSIELYTPKNPRQIYPFSQQAIDQLLSTEELGLVNNSNGKIVWFSNNTEDMPYLRAGKKLLLGNYKFAHGGYIVALIKPDFLDFLKEDFREFHSIALRLKDSTGKDLYFFSEDTSITPESVSEKCYKFVTSKSAYTDWELTICIPYNILNKDLSWVNYILLTTLGIGVLLFSGCCILIAKLISSPINDMKKAMTISNGKLKKNPHQYLNSDINELNSHYNQLVDDNNKLIKEVFEKELSKTQAEIKALQAQVNPHFIINALESVYWCLVQKGDLINSQTLLSLARLFRYILKSNDWISIKEELNFIEEYLQIEKFRFGPKLKWKYQLEESLTTLLIPKLFIHPLVENAVKYAVEATASDVCIILSISGTPDCFNIIVKDNGPGIPEHKLEQIFLSFEDNKPVGSVSQSYGLANLYKRIKLYFGKNSTLKLSSDKNGTTAVIQIHLTPDMP